MKDDPKRRAAENAALLRRMLAGEQCVRVEHQGTWWPPRPIIKKDWDAIRQLEGLAPLPPAPKLQVLDGQL